METLETITLIFGTSLIMFGILLGVAYLGDNLDLLRYLISSQIGFGLSLVLINIGLLTRK